MASFRRAGTRSQAGGHCHVQAHRANLPGAKPADETAGSPENARCRAAATSAGGGGLDF